MVARPEARGSKQPRQMGYFPDEAVACIERIQQLKQGGLSMDEIASKLAEPAAAAAETAAAPVSAQIVPHPASAARNSPWS